MSKPVNTIRIDNFGRDVKMICLPGIFHPIFASLDWPLYRLRLISLHAFHRSFDSMSDQIAVHRAFLLSGKIHEKLIKLYVETLHFLHL